MSNNNRFLLYLLTASIIFCIFGIVYGYNKNKVIYEKKLEMPDLSGGVYIRLVFVGSSECKFANNPETHELVSKIKIKLHSILKNRSINFISTGMSLDISSEIAFKYLNKTGRYDELLLGVGSFNLGVINYVSGTTSTPRILIFQEKYKSDLFGLNIRNFHDSQKLIKSYTGKYEIHDLYEFLNNATEDQVFEYFEIIESN